MFQNLLSLPLGIGYFINFQKLKSRVALSNRVRCVWTLFHLSRMRESASSLTTNFFMHGFVKDLCVPVFSLHAQQ